MNEETLFREALSRPPEERAAFLEQACEGWPELRASVKAFLAAHEEPVSILDRPTGQTVDSGPGQARPDVTVDPTPGPDDASPAVNRTADYHLTSEAGMVIAGRYSLQQKIGKGGMGEVWAAKQTEPVKRRVALKLIKTGMDSRAVLQRFEQERQALAMMDHPNIAKVLDGGLTPTGQPFFVMELVNGLPLTNFCDGAKLTTRERLELFVPICQAVQHAHQKGIVHRDLKPANILVSLVDGKPVPKVIDFGVAKAIAGKLTDESMSTQFGAVIGTLEYMSPEQAGFSGVDIDTRSDIYLLGVILYELLTGLRPIDAKRLRNAALTEMVRIIREEEPPKPSTRLSTDDRLPSMAALRQTEPRKLMAMLRGELDWVVMKCLEKHRERRYETANGLARDIQRYLADEAVEARPPSVGYRLSKFLRRHRAPVVGASVVVLALVAGMVGTTYGLIRAESRRLEADRARANESKQRGIAEANEAKALVAAEAERKARDREAQQRVTAEKARDRTRQALDAMTSSATGDSLTTQKEVSGEQKKFLTEVLTYYREFAGEKADDRSSRARTALAAARVGVIEYRLGRTGEAKAAYRLAIDGYTTLVAEFPAVPLFRRDLAVSHNNLGLLLSDMGMRLEAEEPHRKALAIQEKLAADFPAVALYRQDLAQSHNNLGFLLQGIGTGPEAEQQLRKALAIEEELAALFPAVPEYRNLLGVSHNNLGNLLAGLGKRPEAEQQHRQALAIEEKLVADFPTVPEFRKRLADSHSHLGLVLQGMGNALEAEQQIRQALAIEEKLVADYPAVPEYRKSLAGSHNSLGRLLGRLGKRPEADEQHRQALAIQEKLVALFPAVPAYRRDLGYSHNNLGNVMTGRGKPLEADEHGQKALAIREKLVAEFPAVPGYRRDLGDSHNNLGLLLAGLGRRPEAENQYRQALVIREKLVAEFPAVVEHREELGVSHNNLANLLTDLGKRLEAENHFREALAIDEKLVAEFPAVPQYQLGLGASYCNFGILVRNSGQPGESLAWFEKAIRTLTAVYEQDRRSVLARQFLRNSHSNRASACERLRKFTEAIKDWDKAIELSPMAEQPRFRAERAATRLQAGHVTEAVAEFDELTKNASGPAGSWYDFACVYAIASGKSADKKQEYADRAMELLRNALKAGWKNAAHMAKDTDLDAIRGRDDFKKLMKELAAKPG